MLIELARGSPHPGAIPIASNEWNIRRGCLNDLPVDLPTMFLHRSHYILDSLPGYIAIEVLMLYHLHKPPGVQDTSQLQ